MALFLTLGVTIALQIADLIPVAINKLGTSQRTMLRVALSMLARSRFLTAGVITKTSTLGARVACRAGTMRGTGSVSVNR